MDKPPLTVSLLDDDPSILKATTRLLHSAGLTVAAFHDPHTFLHFAASHPLPVAVLDVCMPAMNGLDVQTRLRKVAPAAKVIFLTGSDDPSARERALAAGAHAFLLKPADDNELLSVIHSAADEKNSAHHRPLASRSGSSRTNPA